MPNTKGTILENWPGPKTSEAPRKPSFHFAIKQRGVSLDFHLHQFFSRFKVSCHFFNTFDSLLTLCQRFPIDAVLIGSNEELSQELSLVRDIKRNVFLSIIPVILYNPEPDDATRIAAFESGAEEFIHGEWVDALVGIRIKKVVERNRRDLAVNPSTRLPGPTLIEGEINTLLQTKSEFAVCYADLDNFKAYNDYYGYDYGDKVIRLTARIIKDVVFDLCREGFVGHIAGDDFIFIIPPSLIDNTCSYIIKTFDAIVPYRYAEEDRLVGHITTTSRRGELEQFDLLTISIAVLVNANGKFEHVGEMSKMLADLKKAVKSHRGSNYLVERRAKY